MPCGPELITILNEDLLSSLRAATLTFQDVDDNGDPIGLTGTLTTGDAGTGNLQVILRHEPTKTSTGATGGETDVDVLFPIVVE